MGMNASNADNCFAVILAFTRYSYGRVLSRGPERLLPTVAYGPDQVCLKPSVDSF